MKVAIILICIFFSAAFANRNAWQQQEAGSQNLQASKKWHLWEWLVKLSFALALGVLTATWFHKVFAVLMVASIDFFFFPLVLNLRTGQRWDYLSARGIDKYLRKIPSVLLLFIKVALLLVSVTYYITNPF